MNDDIGLTCLYLECISHETLQLCIHLKNISNLLYIRNIYMEYTADMIMIENM